MLNSGLGPKSDIAKMDDVGWKAKLKIPPKDIRMKTSVSIFEKLKLAYMIVLNQCLNQFCSFKTNKLYLKKGFPWQLTFYFNLFYKRMKLQFYVM